MLAQLLCTFCFLDEQMGGFAPKYSNTDTGLVIIFIGAMILDKRSKDN